MKKTKPKASQGKVKTKINLYCTREEKEEKTMVSTCEWYKQ